MTLHQLRALLERALYADGPTPPHVARLGSTITIKDLARAYLPVYITFAEPPIGSRACNIAESLTWAHVERWAFDFTDPGTVHAVKVALALALGLDPGPMGCACRWQQWAPREEDDSGWLLEGEDGYRYFDRDVHMGSIPAPTVAAEPDPVRALILAVEHVLCSPA